MVAIFTSLISKQRINSIPKFPHYIIKPTTSTGLTPQQNQARSVYLFLGMFWIDITIVAVIHIWKL